MPILEVYVRDIGAALPMPAVVRRVSPTVLMWLPAALLLLLGIAAANGLATTGSATAATSTVGPVTVSAVISTEIHANYSGVNACHSTGDANGTLNFNNTHGTISSTTGLITLACSVTFGTNNGAAGAILDIKSDATGAPFFAVCAIGSRPGCVNPTEQFPDVGANAANLDPDGSNRGRFGARFAVAGDLTGATAQGDWTGNDWNPIGTVASNICQQTTVNTDATCNLTFGMDPFSGNQSGSYSGQATFTATAT